MNKTELINVVAGKTDYSKKDVAEVVTATFDAITEAVKSGDEVSVPNFGKFSVKESAARTCRNPQTGEQISVPASKNMKFKASSVIKKIMNA